MSNKPILQRSDVTEMFDRAKMALIDLSQIAADKDCMVYATVFPTGSISFEVSESTEETSWDKKLYFSDGYERYEETVFKR